MDGRKKTYEKTAAGRQFVVLERKKHMKQPSPSVCNVREKKTKES